MVQSVMAPVNEPKRVSINNEQDFCQQRHIQLCVNDQLDAQLRYIIRLLL